MKKNDILLIGIVVTFLIIWVWMFMYIHNSKAHFKNIVNLSEESTYKIDKRAEMFGVEPEGRLGDMFACLTKFRRTSHRIPSKGSSGETGMLSMYVDGRYKITSYIVNGEVLSASLMEYDKNGKFVYDSGSVTLNCDIKLLNRFD
ncbi:hypothetical protein JC606_02980 [Vibrio sp. IB15]|uniref:hypothetical protein n=1 Tax=Vibrio sp. IB15 TaxID=2779368 RepID=UPI0018E8F033|nr:hypothetical protein [Vibrio sp. IB15]MBJ2145344.1 hypothetical protein [Vibrio sp. IB15]